MDNIFIEIQENLENAIDNLRDFFENYDFNTKNGFSSGDLDGVSGFESVAVVDSQVLDFDQFKKLIKRGLFSLDDDYKVSDFDWDDLYNYYDAAVENYNEYQSILDQVESNLTGDQDLNNFSLYSIDELKDALYEHYLNENKIYEISKGNGELVLLLNDSLVKELKDVI